MSEAVEHVGVEKELLDLAGLDESDLLADEEVIKGKESFEDEEEEGEEPHTELKFYEQGWVQAGAMGLAVGFVTLTAGVFLSSSFGVGRKEGFVSAAYKQEQGDAAARGFLEMTPNEKDIRLSELEAQRAILDQRYKAEIFNLRRQQEAVQQVEPQEENFEDRALSGRKRKQEEIENLQEPVIVAPPPPEASNLPSVLPQVEPVPQKSVADMMAEWQAIWRFQQELGSFKPGDVNPVVKAKLSTSTNKESAQSSVGGHHGEDSGSSQETENFLLAPEGVSPPSVNFDASKNYSSPPKNLEYVKKNNSLESSFRNDAFSLSESSSFRDRYGRGDNLYLASSSLEGLIGTNSRIRAEQEAFLRGYIYPDEDFREDEANKKVLPKKVLGGTQITGYVKTPIFFFTGDAQASERIFSIEISESTDIFPAGSLVIGRITTVAPNGLVMLTGTVIVSADGVEYKVPENSIEIRGEGGKPLIAKRFEPGKLSEIAKVLGGAITNGVYEMVRLYNEPEVNQKIITQKNSEDIYQEIITDSKNVKNYPAALLNGALSFIKPKLEEWLKTEKDISMNLWYVEAGRKVDIFFSRSMQLNPS